MNGPQPPGLNQVLAYSHRDDLTAIVRSLEDDLSAIAAWDAFADVNPEAAAECISQLALTKFLFCRYCYRFSGGGTFCCEAHGEAFNSSSAHTEAEKSAKEAEDAARSAAIAEWEARKARGSALRVGRPIRAGFVYRLLDADRAVLYVGETGNLPIRLLAHSAKKEWFHRVRFVEVHEYESKAVAREAEVWVKEECSPLYDSEQRRKKVTPECPSPVTAHGVWAIEHFRNSTLVAV